MIATWVHGSIGVLPVPPFAISQPFKQVLFIQADGSLLQDLGGVGQRSALQIIAPS